MIKKAGKEILAINNKMIPEGMDYEEFEKLKAEEIAAQQAILDQCEKDLDYINFFPHNEKYISLYIKTEMPEEVLAKRDQLRVKVQNLKNQKLASKKREMKYADKVTDEVTDTKHDIKKQKEIISKKIKEIPDTFFVPSDQEVEEDEYTRIVDKSGKVIKIEDPIKARLQRSREQGAYTGAYNNDNDIKKANASKPKPFVRKVNAKPQVLKIKARTYRVNNADLAKDKKTHIKF